MPQADAASGRQADYSLGSDSPAAELIRKCIADAAGNTARLERDKQDLKNLLTYRGGADNHWTVWDQTTGMWVPRPYTGIGALPEWVPRACTNVFASKIDGIVSLLVAATPALTWKPATNDDNDLAAAEVAQDATPVLLEEIDWDRLKRDLSLLVALTNQAAVFYSYDNDPRWGTDEIEAYRCNNPECGAVVGPMDLEESGNVCPTCGSQDIGLALNADASPMTAQYPKGRIRADLLSSFEYSLPSSARQTSVERVPWILGHARIPTENCHRLWPKAKSAIQIAAGQSTNSATQRHFADQLSKLSSPRAYDSRQAGASVRNAGPVVYRLQHDPVEDDESFFPEGLYAVMIGDEVVEAGPLPLADELGRPVKTAIVRTFRDGPGAAYGKPPADDLDPLQYQRNLLETLQLLISMNHAAPRTWVPMSVTLEDEITGQPGGIYRYRSMTPGDHPVTERGLNPPESLNNQIDRIDEKMEQLSGMNSVLQGQRPEGDPTLGEIQILQEQGQAAFKTPLDAQVDFEKEQARMLLRIARSSWWSPRFRQVRGENGEWEVQQFSAANLAGNVDVTCDPSSAWPKSPLMQSMRIKQAVELGILTPAQDPELSSKLLEQQNLAELKPSLDVDRKQVARELDRWRAATSPAEIAPPRAAPLISLPIHIHLKSLFLRTEEFEALEQQNPALAQAMVEHVLALQQMQAQQQMQQALMSGAVRPPQAKEAPPDKRSAVEKGDTSGLDDALKSGALRPAGVGQAKARAAGGGLEDAVQSGALRPAGMAMSQPQPMGGGPSIDDVTEMRAHQPLMGG